ncbi:hypothetical protein ESZ50_06830 [Weissella muntiaci]|uniref:BspA family leucine-rich repeat surface protein n=1 Tax=Weissella muntiaci TaxID=2508881 RepID=A0A6C2C4R4_9LACO|nr:hypothetical protein [Weissella muntiaci]TYC48961.1 hypothetical protein ESZ50_06830 [Weissella muntiaci]
MKNKFSIGNYKPVSRWLLTGIGGLVIVAFIANDGYVVATTMSEPTRIQSAGTQGTWGSVAWYFENRRLVLLTGVAPEVAEEPATTAFLNDPDLREILPLLEEIEIAGEITVGAQGAALFKGLPNLTKITGLANLKLASTEDIHEMFADNPKLVSLDSENLTVASAKNVNRMFANNPMLEELNLIKVDFKGLSMNRASNIFQGTHNLKKITFMNKAFGQQYHDNLGRAYNHVANEDESLEHVPNDAQYGGKWIQLKSGTERYPIYTATSAVLTGKQLLQHLGTTSAPGGTWVWAPAIMGVQ